MSEARSAPSSLAASNADARFAVTVLTGINLLNYIDRYVPSAVKNLFKEDLGLTDTQTSVPLSAFVIVYMLASPVFGALADRYSRRALIASGVALWSVATAAAAAATGFWTFLLARALVGVGEAAYATIAPALLSDFFPPERRNRVLTLFNVAIPIGAALGFVLGGVLGAAYGWRAAFLVCGLPGVLAALLVLRTKDPGKGVFDTEKVEAATWPDALRALAGNPTFRVAVAGYTAVTFASGGMADWLPTWLYRVHGMDMAAAGTVVGGVTVLAGLGGTVAGGLLADRLGRHTKNPYLALAALSMLPATVLAAVALAVPDKVTSIACIGLAQFFMWFYNGPINAVVANAVPAAMRARAFSVSILVIHMLGDAISPTILGAVSDATGNLTLAVSIAPVAMGVAALTWLVGWRRL